VIIVEQADPEVIYVPAYNPTVIYGGWPYPAYPPSSTASATSGPSGLKGSPSEAGQ